jgi:single-strand DNA-binding protein
MSVNKVILVGNVGKDPEVKYIDGNKVVARITLATNESYRDRNGQNVEQTEWHNIEMWDDLARLAEKYVKKGKMIYVEGKLRTNKWMDKETNQERQSKFIRATAMTFLGGNDRNGQQGGGEEGGSSSYNRQPINNNQPASNNNYEAPVAPEPMPEDDLPF